MRVGDNYFDVFSLRSISKSIDGLERFQERFLLLSICLCIIMSGRGS